MHALTNHLYVFFFCVAGWRGLADPTGGLADPTGDWRRCSERNQAPSRQRHAYSCLIFYNYFLIIIKGLAKSVYVSVQPVGRGQEEDVELGCRSTKV